jgi:23S rRNA (cytosine1962-C5)-methyltransferase
MSGTRSTEAFQNRLAKVWKHNSKIARKQGISCFRVYDHDLPEAPFAIDWLEGLVHAAEYKRRHGMEDEEHTAWLDACKAVIATVLGIEDDLIFMKERQRKAGRQGQYQKFDATKAEYIVKENDLSFILNMTDYLDTGLFLDHRLTRDLVRKEADGKRVLNLFCYTGSFSVYAADGGAEHVTSVDMSRTYINWAKRNMQYNKLFKPFKHDYIQADVLEWIDTELKPETYDLIVCDPPTFSNSKRMDGEWDVQRDHAALLTKLIAGLTTGGRIYFSNNYRGFALDDSIGTMAKVKDITAATTPFDFAGRLNRVCYLIEKVV